MARRWLTLTLLLILGLLAGCGSSLSGDSTHASVATGSARVSMAPGAAVTGGARWTLDTQTTLRISGATVTGITPGTHTVHFNNVTGYNKPADQTITVLANATASAVGTYTLVGATGSIRVTLSPGAAITAGGRWTIDTQTTLRTSGSTVTSIPVGSHTIHFTAVTGYNKPADQVLTVPTNGTATTVGSYTLVGATGLVRVTMSPGAAVTAGARWTLDSATTQYTSGTTVSAVPVGSHVVHFSTVKGYTTPANQAITVTSGGTATTTGTYK